MRYLPENLCHRYFGTQMSSHRYFRYCSVPEKNPILVNKQIEYITAVVFVVSVRTCSEKNWQTLETGCPRTSLIWLEYRKERKGYIFSPTVATFYYITQSQFLQWGLNLSTESTDEKVPVTGYKAVSPVISVLPLPNSALIASCKVVLLEVRKVRGKASDYLFYENQKKSAA